MLPGTGAPGAPQTLSSGPTIARPAQYSTLWPRFAEDGRSLTNPRTLSPNPRWGGTCWVEAASSSRAADSAVPNAVRNRAFLLFPPVKSGNTVTMSNPVVFFDVSAGSTPLGRIEMTVCCAFCAICRSDSNFAKFSTFKAGLVLFGSLCICTACSGIFSASCSARP